MPNKKASGKVAGKNPYKKNSGHLKLVHSQAGLVKNPNYKISNREFRKIGHSLTANVPKYRRAG